MTTVTEAALYTRCPKCETAFKVSQSILHKAKGKVRCGACLHVFQANEHLLRVKQQAGETKPQPEKRSMLERAAIQQANQLGDALEQVLENDSDAVDQSFEESMKQAANRQPIGQMAEEDLAALDEALEQEVADIAGLPPENDDSAASESESHDDGSVDDGYLIEDSQSTEDNPTETAAKEDGAAEVITDDALSETESVLEDADALASEHQLTASLSENQGEILSEDWLTEDRQSEDGQFEEGQVKEGQSEAGQFEAGQFEDGSDIEAEHDVEASPEASDAADSEETAEPAELSTESDGALTSAPAPAESFEPEDEVLDKLINDEHDWANEEQTLAEELENEEAQFDAELDPLRLAENLNGQLEGTDTTPDPLEEFEDMVAEKKQTPRILMLVALVVILLGVGFYQFWTNRQQLAWSDDWGDTVKRVCQFLPCDLKPRRDVAAIKLRQREVSADENNEKVLDIKMLITNDASFAQPYPTIVIKFSNSLGEQVAQRKVEPADYLNSGDLKRLMPAQSEVHIRFKTPLPHPDALGFEFQFQ